MPIPTELFVLTRGERRYGFKRESIQFADGETLEVKLNRDGTVYDFELSKRDLTLTLEGATGEDLAAFEAERENNLRGLINNTLAVEDLILFDSYTIYGAYLSKVNPSEPMQIAGTVNYNQIELIFKSTKYV